MGDIEYVEGVLSIAEVFMSKDSSGFGGENVFVVWRDPLFEEWFACPKEEMTQVVRDVLRHSHTVVQEVHASSAKAALDLVRPPSTESLLPPSSTRPH